MNILDQAGALLGEAAKRYRDATAYPRPICRVEVNGRDITSEIEQRLVSIELTDNRGMEADQLDITLSDHDGLLAIPPRGATVRLPFLGRPAPFSDGPFRLAALLRRKLLFMAGVYLGGNRYQVVFEPLADFSARIADPVLREQRIREALEAYVRRLELLCRTHPCNWFNFHDFWLDDETASPD